MNVLFVGNCQRNIYKEALRNAKIKNLSIDEFITYQNLDSFSILKSKLLECDLLIIQPVVSYDEFKLDNIIKYVKDACTVIRIPYLRFGGFWPVDNVSLNKFKSSLVTMPCKIKDERDIEEYLNFCGKNEIEIQDHFHKCLKNFEKKQEFVDIQYIDFFNSNYKKILLFKDIHHPSEAFKNILANSFYENLNKKLNLSIPTARKDMFPFGYGHYNVITNDVGSALGLEYDLDSCYPISRYDYLNKIIKYEKSDNKKIDGWPEFTSFIKN
jgi:hypothetical protein